MRPPAEGSPLTAGKTVYLINSNGSAQRSTRSWQTFSDPAHNSEAPKQTSYDLILFVSVDEQEFGGTTDRLPENSSCLPRRITPTAYVQGSTRMTTSSENTTLSVSCRCGLFAYTSNVSTSSHPIRQTLQYNLPANSLLQSASQLLHLPITLRPGGQIPPPCLSSHVLTRFFCSSCSSSMYSLLPRQTCYWVVAYLQARQRHIMVSVACGLRTLDVNATARRYASTSYYPLLIGGDSDSVLFIFGDIPYRMESRHIGPSIPLRLSTSNISTMYTQARYP